MNAWQIACATFIKMPFSCKLISIHTNTQKTLNDFHLRCEAYCTTIAFHPEWKGHTNCNAMPNNIQTVWSCNVCRVMESASGCNDGSCIYVIMPKFSRPKGKCANQMQKKNRQILRLTIYSLTWKEIFVSKIRKETPTEWYNVNEHLSYLVVFSSIKIVKFNRFCHKGTENERDRGTKWTISALLLQNCINSCYTLIFQMAAIHFLPQSSQWIMNTKCIPSQSNSHRNRDMKPDVKTIKWDFILVLISVIGNLIPFN